MTVDTTGSNLPAVPDDDEDFTGLEDFGDEDFRTPRLKINHKGEPYFFNPATKERYDSLEVVVLCLVRQRIKWAPDLEDNAVPQCKSQDFKTGYPTLIAKDPDNLFPWNESNFDESDMIEDADGRHMLSCDSCTFAQWRKVGTKDKPPLCAEMHSYAVLIVETGETYILSMQKSAITPSKAFASSFRTTRTPMYQKVVELSLKQDTKGGNEYSVPIFKILGSSDSQAWDTYATQGRNLRDFLRRPPRANVEEQGANEGKNAAQANTGPAPKTQQKPPAATPNTPPAAAATPEPDSDNDLPF